MTILYAPAGYWKLTDQQKKIVCNGCGAKGLGGFIVPDTLYGLSIEEACNIHDFMYCRGQTIDDKKEADRVFLNNMTRIIDDHTSVHWLRALRRKRAKTYYEAVKLFGAPAFWRGKNNHDNLRSISI
jgi:hypothetical protein